MKPTILKLMLSLLFFSQTTFAGNEGGHGGGSEPQEFQELAQKIYQELNQPMYAELMRETGLNLTEFRRVLQATLVTAEPGEEMLLNGSEMDAINFPTEMRIKINRDRWPLATSEAKLKLVLHEYMGLLDLERDNYNVSIRFVRVLQKVLQDLLRSPTSSLRYYGVCTVSPPLYASNITCSAGDPAMQQLLACAQTQAQQRCQSENGPECQSVVAKVERYSSPAAPQFIFCRAEAVFKK